MNRQFLTASFTFAVSLLLGTVLAFYPTPARSGETKPASSQVSIDNFAFGPETLTVPVNTTVTWVNKDDVPHVVASTDGLFKSKALDTDDKYSFTFTKPGTYNYFCSIHPKMTGKIVVQ